MIWGGGENQEKKFEGPSPGKKISRGLPGKKISKGLAEEKKTLKCFPLRKKVQALF